MLPKDKLMVVMGDVHANISLAKESLQLIEYEKGRNIAQVFSVGDFGLFLEEADWAWLSGPSRHRFPEKSKAIRETWEQWPWPTAMIGGNHEPMNRLRSGGHSGYGSKLTYCHAGVLPTSVEGLTVYGLSGILAETHQEFPPGISSWEQWMAHNSEPGVFMKRWSYYKQTEIEYLKRLPKHPDILLTHDWPKTPSFLPKDRRQSTRPEGELVCTLEPRLVFCGHMHHPEKFSMGESQVHALNIITRNGSLVNPGWAAIIEDGNVEFWPPLLLRPGR
jgi:hypothetical protein